MNIKNIIFDLGNVILNVDTKRSEEAFLKQGITDFSELYTLAVQTEIFDRLEKGEITQDEFCAEFRGLTKSVLPDNLIVDCWNAMILDFPPERIELLKKLKSKFRTFILSNTNIIHYNLYTGIMKEQFKLNGLEELVEKAYFSHKIGMRKPNRDVFNYVLDDSGLVAAETLFIDDNYDNIYTAGMIGIETLWLKDNNLQSHEVWKEYL